MTASSGVEGAYAGMHICARPVDRRLQLWQTRGRPLHCHYDRKRWRACEKSRRRALQQCGASAHAVTSPHIRVAVKATRRERCNGPDHGGAEERRRSPSPSARPLPSSLGPSGVPQDSCACSPQLCARPLPRDVVEGAASVRGKHSFEACALCIASSLRTVGILGAEQCASKP